ncbi:FAD/NAD(P)-binding protein [Nesterenkonia sp. HG001]|uniref:FAD/NAD(P)-binding protein n=1 Tax=Nesterenkonia sp. HG001 TaxID=2983207 RepID=UPI002AC5B6CC|nr:FAD/NAD(P)-binding protein [Nesterenkonia sp. HG001]MDZ5076408.1 FAD/NAD(P)-binding protein [Nesterenkonia sp. HG001]
MSQAETPQTASASREHVIAVVGAGPRGTSFLERLLAHLDHVPDPVPQMRIVVLDPAAHGPGRVWDPEQSPLYLMNTPASYPTAAPAGETRHELAASEISLSFARWRRTRLGKLDDADYPTRADYGRYLTELHEDAVALLGARDGVEVEARRVQVTRLHRYDDKGQDGEGQDGAARSPLLGSAPGPYRLICDDGAVLAADAVVLALGHVPARLSDSGQHLAEVAGDLGLHYSPPAIPTDVDVDSIPAGETVLVRGMGLNFFDLMIQLSAGRGGRFRHLPENPPGRRLEYHRSGGEPHLVAGARRGAPYRAKTTAAGFVPAGIRLVHFTDEAVEGAERRHDLLDFAAHLWPLIHRDVLRTYYRTLAAVSPELFPAGPDAFLVAFDELLTDPGVGEQVLAVQGQHLLHEHAPDVLWFDIRSLGRPFDDLVFDSSDHHRDHMLAYLEDDATTSAAGAASPVKMAIGALHAARMELKALISEGRVSTDSQVAEIEGWFEPLVEGLASGPPLQRIEELAALTRAGVVDFLGPDPVFDVDREARAFTAESPWVATEPVRAHRLVEAMMPANRVQMSCSPLVAGLLEDGLARPKEVVDVSGTARAGKGFDVTETPHRLIDAEGTPLEGVYVLGLQLSSVQWGTAIAAESGGDPRSGARTLADADAAAGSILQSALGG